MTFAAVPASTATRNVGEKVVVIDAGPLVLGGNITPTAYEGTITDQGTLLPDPGRSGLALHRPPGLRPARPAPC